MTLYQLVKHGDMYEGGDSTYGIFTTRALAEEAMRRLSIFDLEIEESEADVLPEEYVQTVREPVFERELTPMEKMLADACNKQLVAAFNETTTARWFWAPPGHDAAAAQLLKDTQ